MYRHLNHSGVLAAVSRELQSQRQATRERHRDGNRRSSQRCPRSVHPRVAGRGQAERSWSSGGRGEDYRRGPKNLRELLLAAQYELPSLVITLGRDLKAIANQGGQNVEA